MSYPLSMVGVGLAALITGGSADSAALLVGALAGGLARVVVLWFYLALADGPMSVVSPLTALLVAGVPLATGVALGERPGPLALVGAGLAVVAVVLVSREDRSGSDETPTLRFTTRVGWLTVGSGATFGGYFVLLDQVPAGAGLWPLAMSRMVAAISVVALAASLARQRPAGGAPARLAVAAATSSATSPSCTRCRLGCCRWSAWWRRCTRRGRFSWPALCSVSAPGGRSRRVWCWRRWPSVSSRAPADPDLARRMFAERRSVP